MDSSMRRCSDILPAFALLWWAWKWRQEEELSSGELFLFTFSIFMFPQTSGYTWNNSCNPWKVMTCLTKILTAVHRGHSWRALHHESWCWTSPHPLHRKELDGERKGDLGQTARPRPGPLGGLSLLNVQQTPVEHPVNKSVFTTTSKSIFSRTYYNQDHLLYKHFSGVWPYLL